VSLANDVQPIFTSSCALSGCHDGIKHEEQLNLSKGASYGSLVNVDVNKCQQQPPLKRVVPSNVAASYLINKLTGVGMCPGEKQMPLDGNGHSQPLPQSQIDTITAWVCEGAPNN
jgi:hypothetical protein